jgi:hypothetical protein
MPFIESRFQGGIASEVEQAKTILQTTETQAIDVGVLRAQYRSENNLRHCEDCAA